MDLFKRIMLYGLTMLLAGVAAGCSRSTEPALANELAYPVDSLTEIKITYDDEDITYFAGDGDQLVIREYMTESKSAYHAKVTERDGTLHISEGGKPLAKSGFHRYVEVYLPAGYKGTLITGTTSGDIDPSGLTVELANFQCSTTSDSVRLYSVRSDAIQLQTTSGSYECGSIAGDTVNLRSTSGSFLCDEVVGSIHYATTSGDIQIRTASGAGNFEASNSGVMDIAYTEVNGDLSLSNRNDDITLTLLEDLEFSFVATTKNGMVETDFSQYLTMGKGSVSGDVGAEPSVSIELQSNDGDIRVAR